jgi:hypothetical protein
MLGKIFDYIYRFTDIKGNSPRYGDDDDGSVTLLEHEKDFNNFKSLLTSAAIIFNDPKLKSKSNGFDMKNQILFGEEGRKKYESISSIKSNLKSCNYRDEGHFIFRKQDRSNEIYIHFSAAPLGYLTIAAHGHSDALSFVLHHDGKKVLIDSGTFTYHTHPCLRQYFIGTLAHNTIRINRKNQALNVGPTLWLKHYRTNVKEVISNEKYDKIVASHNGYKSLGIEHIRELTFDKKNNTILINDLLDCNSGNKYFIEFPLHLHPEMFPKKHKNYISVSDANENQLIKIYYDMKLNIKVVKGQKSPLMGWYSRSFYQKEPTYVIYQTLRADSSVLIKTKIDILKNL